MVYTTEQMIDAAAKATQMAASARNFVLQVDAPILHKRFNEFADQLLVMAEIAIQAADGNNAKQDDGYGLSSGDRKM